MFLARHFISRLFFLHVRNDESSLGIWPVLIRANSAASELSSCADKWRLIERRVATLEMNHFSMVSIFAQKLKVSLFFHPFAFNIFLCKNEKEELTCFVHSRRSQELIRWISAMIIRSFFLLGLIVRSSLSLFWFWTFYLNYFTI